MAIRVMHVVEALGIGGGVENGIANLVAHMDSRRFEHVLCAIFQLGGQTDRFPGDRVTMHCLGAKRERGSSQFGALSKKIREIQPDVVHSRNWGAIESVFAARWAGARSIHSEHGVEAEQTSEPLRRRGLRRLAYHTAHRVFAVSRELQQSVAQRSGFALRKIEVIHNGVDNRRFRPDEGARRRFRAENGIGDGEFVIGCVGRMNPVKDYATMLQAAERFGGRTRSWRLILAGDGPERQRLEETAVASDVLRGRVLFAGNTERVPELLNALDLYVLPSITEGISNSLLEAMATGVAVLATRTGGTPEVVEDGRSGVLVPVQAPAQMAEQLARLSAATDERHKLGQAAQARVAKMFSIDAMVRRYETLYAEAGSRGAAEETPRAALLASGKSKD